MIADHGYCKSLYITDPNGLLLEFTVDHPDVEKIDAIRRDSAHHDLARWLSGDHSSNNDWRADSWAPVDVAFGAPRVVECPSTPGRGHLPGREP
jgi:hypothetical protein